MKATMGLFFSEDSSNPAQLALVTCSLGEARGLANIGRFTDLVKKVVFSDYYVVGAVAKNRDNLTKFQNARGAHLMSNEMELRRKGLLERVRGDEVAGFSRAIDEGAERCRIEDVVKEKIYRPFELKSEISQSIMKGKEGYQLLLGGRINAKQASDVVEFLESEFRSNSELQKVAADLTVEIKPYMARMLLDE